MNWIFRRGVLGGLALLLTGCATTPVLTYDPTHRSEQPATLQESDGVYCMLINSFVTDAPTSGLLFPGIPKSYSVLPGKVTVATTYCRSDSTGKIESLPKTVTFVAEAGHAYRFRSDVPFRMFFSEIRAEEWDVTVVEKDTGAVIVATHDRKK